MALDVSGNIIHLWKKNCVLQSELPVHIMLMQSTSCIYPTNCWDRSSQPPSPFKLFKIWLFYIILKKYSPSLHAHKCSHNISITYSENLIVTKACSKFHIFVWIIQKLLKRANKSKSSLLHMQFTWSLNRKISF